MPHAVLLVDDERFARTVYSDYLRAAGYDVEVAESGIEALRKVEASRPDLVTLDVKMPGLDGIEVLRRIRQVDASLPVLLLTAFGEFRQDFNTWASDAYIVKSADLTELKTTVRALLGGR